MIGQHVNHKSFGEGTITNIDENYISVSFASGEKSFVYPDAFQGFLTMKNDSSTDQIAADIRRKEEAQKKRQLALEQRVAAERAQKSTHKTGVKRNTPKKNARKNIAFKCNYCDGGRTKDRIGFHGVCSDSMINYNITVAHHVWCSAEESPCRQYHDGLINRSELDNNMSSDENKGFVCYESAMLRDWRASAGIVQTGKNKGKPMRLLSVQPMSLAVLTTREPHSTDDTRFVFAVFLVDETYEGDNRDEGFVTTSSDFRLHLNPEEAQKIKFWNYYYNINAPKRIKFGSGLHRYLSAEQAAQILRDIADVKRNTPDESLANRFFQYFCKINAINMDALPTPYGALMR